MDNLRVITIATDNDFFLYRQWNFSLSDDDFFPYRYRENFHWHTTLLNKYTILTTTKVVVVVTYKDIFHFAFIGAYWYNLVNESNGG